MVLFTFLTVASLCLVELSVARDINSNFLSRQTIDVGGTNFPFKAITPAEIHLYNYTDGTFIGFDPLGTTRGVHPGTATSAYADTNELQYVFQDKPLLPFTTDKITDEAEIAKIKKGISSDFYFTGVTGAITKHEELGLALDKINFLVCVTDFLVDYSVIKTGCTAPAAAPVVPPTTPTTTTTTGTTGTQSTSRQTVTTPSTTPSSGAPASGTGTTAATPTTTVTPPPLNTVVREPEDDINKFNHKIKAFIVTPNGFNKQPFIDIFEVPIPVYEPKEKVDVVDAIKKNKTTTALPDATKKLTEEEKKDLVVKRESVTKDLNSLREQKKTLDTQLKVKEEEIKKLTDEIEELKKKKEAATSETDKAKIATEITKKTAVLTAAATAKTRLAARIKTVDDDVKEKEKYLDDVQKLLNNNSSGKLGGGSLSGIVIGALVGIAVIGGLVYFFVIKEKE